MTSGQVALAVTLHDPQSSMLAQARKVSHVIARCFAHMTVYATPTSGLALRTHLQEQGAIIRLQEHELADGLRQLGSVRREAVKLALETGALHVFYCDFDRILHWAEFYPDELATVAQQITQYDFCVLGRTARAFDSHPRVQVETEQIVNNVFAQVSGQEWDVLAAARGLSPAAIACILQNCADDTLGVDTSWPLCILRHPHLTTGYLETEGLEFETADRHGPEVDAAGGRTAWISQVDASPARWARRLEMAQIEMASIVEYQ
ncbi:MAG: hypothetical protein R3A44_02005 [Caldilineaceae bacterium]